MTKKTKNAQILTTERGGIARIICGCIMLALGMGWLFALTMGTVSAWNSLRIFRDTANGLGGVMCFALPILALYLGTLLCSSARRRVSFRPFLLIAAIYLCVLALLTLLTDVSSRGNTLMAYIANNNKAVLGLTDNTSFSAYLYGAYNLRGFNGGQLAGGGLLGMLLAYPLYAALNKIGAVAVLLLLIMFLLLFLFRINPLSCINALSDAHYEKKKKQQERQKAMEQETAAPAPNYAECPAWEAAIPQQQVNYTTTSVHTDVQESYLVKDEDENNTSFAAAGQNFVSAERGKLYMEHIPVGKPENDGVRTAKPEPAKTVYPERDEDDGHLLRQKTEPPAGDESPLPPYVHQVTMNECGKAEEKNTENPVPEQESEKALQKPVGPVYQQNIPVEEDESEEDEVPWNDEPEEPVLPPTPAPKPVMPRPGTVRVEQVHTAPAVPLTGKHIAIHPENEEEYSDDPFAEKHTAEKIKPVLDPYCFPPVRLLAEPSAQITDTREEDAERSQVLEHTLASFKITGKVERVVHGPTITRFALRLADGINVNKLNNISNNIALAMKSTSIHIEIINGTSLVGIEVPNAVKRTVNLKEVLESPVMRANKSPTAVALGMDISGTPVICDLSKMPHLLIAGATGSGKSVCINAILESIMYRATPQQVRLLLIDPKVVELQPYNGIPHLLTGVVSDPKRSAAALDWLVEEMRDRYRRFERNNVRNIQGYNDMMISSGKEDEVIPHIVAIIDEFRDLMAQARKSVEESIQKLSSLARAAGIYLVVATQRPDVNVITGTIKANIPSRIAFAVTSIVDSRTILDTAGAEKLLGKGDMLYAPRDEFRPIRVQGCFVSDREVTDVVEFLKANNDTQYDSRVDEHMEKVVEEEEKEQFARENHMKPGKAGDEDDFEYQADTENEMLQRAIEMAIDCKQTSISMLRRRLGLGHSRAGKLIDTMADMGIISSEEGPKPRRTLITREQYAKMQAEIMDK